MSSADFVQVPPDSAGGKKIDTMAMTVGANTVERQVIVLADPVDPAGYSTILASAPVGTEHGLLVRQVGSVGVTGTFWQATQPVSIAGTVTVSTPHLSSATDSVTTVPSGAAQPVTGTFWQATQPVSGAFFQATQPVSVAGTVAVTPPHLASGTDSVTVAGTVAVSSLPGTPAQTADVAAVATSLGTDGATPPTVPGTGVRGWLRSLYDRLGGTLLVDGSAHTQPVSGTFWQATQPVSGTVTVVDSVPLTVGGSVAVSNLPATQPVSGTVAVSNLPATQPVSGTVAISGTVAATDTFSGGQVLADQTGAGAVLTFTFSAPVQLVWVLDTSGVTAAISRADPFGGVPTATTGIPVLNGTPTPLTVATSSVKVYAPTGTNITVYGYHY